MATAVVFISGRGYNEGLTPLFVMLAAGNLAANSNSVQTGIGAAIVFAELVALYFFSEANFTAANFGVEHCVLHRGLHDRRDHQVTPSTLRGARATRARRRARTGRGIAARASPTSDCASHGSCTTWWRTRWASSQSRPAWVSTSSTPTRRRPNARCRRSPTSADPRSPRSGACSACSAKAKTNGAANYSPAPGLEELDRLTARARRRRPARRRLVRGHAGRAASRRRSHRIPDRAGSTDQRLEARGPRARVRARDVRAGGGPPRDHRRRSRGQRARERRRPRARRHAGAGRGVRRHPRDRPVRRRRLPRRGVDFPTRTPRDPRRQWPTTRRSCAAGSPSSSAPTPTSRWSARRPTVPRRSRSSVASVPTSC